MTKTQHSVIFRDSRNLDIIKDESTDLMITSPPYPMIKMWDDSFSKLNPAIGKALNEEKAELAFELMHQELDKVWKEAYRVLKVGGIACINIGDATRTIGGKFQIHPNHARILSFAMSLGFHALPEVLWVKGTNKPDKFMGSGMLPVGAYVTLEHEHILVLRKERKREFINEEEKQRRSKSAFFWEERNVWFSDKWTDINGISQKLFDRETRDRSAAFPFELAYRLINMFSVQGDTVLDPFLGTGTTTIAALASARNSIGIEIEPNFGKIIEIALINSKEPINGYSQNRIKKHLQFVAKRNSEGKEFGSINNHYNFPVVTKQEVHLKIPFIRLIEQAGDSAFEAEHIYPNPLTSTLISVLESS